MISAMFFSLLLHSIMEPIILPFDGIMGSHLVRQALYFRPFGNWLGTWFRIFLSYWVNQEVQAFLLGVSQEVHSFGKRFLFLQRYLLALNRKFLVDILFSML